MKKYISVFYETTQDYEYSYCCINPKSNEELNYIIDNMKEISKNLFFKNISYEQTIEALQLGVGVTYNKKQLKDDWGNRYYKLNTKKIDAFIIVNSSVEHIFKRKKGTINPLQGRYKKSGNLNTYKHITIGDILPKSKYKVMDIMQHNENFTQVLLKTPKGNLWYDSKQILDYEYN